MQPERSFFQMVQRDIWAGREGEDISLLLTSKSKRIEGITENTEKILHTVALE